jgi:hypothetical protein
MNSHRTDARAWVAVIWTGRLPPMEQESEEKGNSSSCSKLQAYPLLENSNAVL